MTRRTSTRPWQAPGGEPQVVVAMSGGVDSSVTAAPIAEAGYDVVGITLQLYDHGAAVGRKGLLCRPGHPRRAAGRRAARLSPLRARLREPLSEPGDRRFRRQLSRGETPIPCVRCNQTVKFQDLLATARDLGAEALCTGHYVRRTVGEGVPELRGGPTLEGPELFPFATTPEQLDYLRFPLGGMSKSETRGHARRFGLDIADKPDSQDICFVPNGRYGDIVTKLRPEAADPGEIVHVDGTVLGRHEGIVHYTIGQRKGLGIGGWRLPDGTEDTDPLYVVRLEPTARQVIVGPRSALGRDVVDVSDVNWLGGDCEDGQPVLVVALSADRCGGPARLGGGRKASIRLSEPQFGYRRAKRRLSMPKTVTDCWAAAGSPARDSLYSVSFP